LSRKKRKKSSKSRSRIRTGLKAVKLFCLSLSVFFTVVFGFPKGIRCAIPYFTVKKILITGNRWIPSKTVLAKVGISAGQCIFTTDLDGIKQVLYELPNVEDVALRRLFPDIIGVRITERLPIAILEGKSPVLIDINGSILEFDFSSEKIDLPVLTGICPEVEGEISAERFAKAQTILEIYPENIPLGILLGGKEWDSRLKKLSLAWNQIQTHLKPWTQLDLRFRRQIVQKPTKPKTFITAKN
jgi:cell division septal protein FtsQ